MNYKETILKVSTECCRVVLGAVFIFSGFVKAIDPVGFAIKIGEYLASFGLESFMSVSTLAAFNLCSIEFMLGVCLLLGAYRNYASLLTLLFMAFMTPLTLYLALFNPVHDCGCFGDAVVITNWETFGKNVFLTAAAVVVYINHKRIYPLYSYKVIWFVALFAYLFCNGFAYFNYIHQPIVDFRPYKVGANIPSLMVIPEGADEDIYRYAFIYENDGIRKEFDIDHLPTDSSWVFVESTTELIHEGYRPPVEAFNLYNTLGIDMTDDILTDTGAVFLLIVPKLEKARDNRIDEINNLFEYTLDHPGIAFYAVTGSSLEEINYWTDYTGAEYPFLQADEVLLKTIVRSNPGLILLKGGTILGKWNYRDIPDETRLAAFVTEALDGKHVAPKETGLFAAILCTFAVPLLLVWVYDVLRNRRRKTKKEISL